MFKALYGKIIGFLLTILVGTCNADIGATGTMVWPNFFLMNVFFALKGSKLFIITI